jgi:flagellar motor switch protein FliG
MVSLGKDLSSQLLRQFSEEEVEMLCREVARLPNIQAEQAHDVLDEFYHTGLARSYVLEGGVDYAKKMLAGAFGTDEAQSMFERILRSLGTDAADLVALQKSDPLQLAKLIYNEHPQVIALVLSHLIPAQAAALLIALPAELRADVAKRMAQIDQFSPEIVEKIASFIGRRLKTLGEFSRESYGGDRAVAEMMNRLDRPVREELFATISLENKALSETIRELMFVFEDLQKLDKEDMKVLVGKIDRKALSVALKGTGDKMRSHFTQCMSERSAKMLQEDIEAMGPVKIRDVEANQQQIIGLLRQLQAEGAIGNQSAGDKYVT